MFGRDPQLRQPLNHQQLPQMPGIRAITLRALLRAPEPSGLRRLGQVHVGSDPAELLDHEPPAGRRLQRDLELLAAEPRQEPRTAARSAGTTRARCTSPVSVSSHSLVIHPRCWSSPITMLTWGLLKLHGLNACADTLRA